MIRQDVYAGTSAAISYSVIIGYDNWGNIIYTRNPEGAEHFYSYAHTNCENQFVDSKGAPINLFTNSFYSNSIPLECHTLLVGEAFINNGKVQETYYKYDTNGNLTETKTLFPTHDYAVFSGTFDENGQTTFDIDLTELTITDGILVISSIAVPTQEDLHETHSEPGKGWLNTGTWSGKYFMADYLRCVNTDPPDCFDGQTKIGPFEHYPGTPNYVGYTTWVDGNIQYVQTTYTAIVNEYPEKVDYNLNSSSWTEITNNLGSGTTSTSIPAASFVQGLNILQFKETNTYSTKCEWVLYIDQGTTPLEYTTRFTNDIYGNMKSFTDARGNTTFFGHDQNHVYLTSITNALNQTISATYDFNTGLLTSLTDAKGNTTSFEYDILGRVTKKIQPDLTELEAVYDDQNCTVTIYNELDHYAIHYYDGIGRLIKAERYISPSDILTETYTYNYLNKLKTQTDSEGHTYIYEYDLRGRNIRIINPDSTFRSIYYDDGANIISVFDENQHKTEYHYDWGNRLQWVKEYTDSVNYYLTEYTYDSSGNVTSFTDANGNSTYYAYESLFGVTHIAYPDSTIETFSYDAVGNLIQKTDADGSTIFTYNPIYQITGVQYPDQLITFTYDLTGNCITMTDSNGSTAYTYDTRNRLLSETRIIEGESYSVSYQYDAASQLISITYPDQSAVTYEYDPLSRLEAISGYAQFTYNDSLLESMTYSNGTTTSYNYDNCHRPIVMQTQRGDTEILCMNYVYDQVGNITQLEYKRRLNQEWVQSLDTFHYDWLDRLIEAQGDYGLISYSYDPVGNRLSQNDLTYTFNTMNELLSINDGTTFTYDENGNTLTKSKGSDVWSFTYDKRDQLIQVEKNQQIVSQFEYDGDGHRIKKTEWIESLQEYQTIIYVYSGLDVVYEKNLNTNQQATYVYGTTGRIAKKVDGLIDYYHTDHLGSTRLLTNESGNIVTDIQYKPFGESTVNGEESYLYTGKEKDETGLYYYGARYYDPEIGRFLTRDKAEGKREMPQTLNRFIYCLNNPLRYIDPTGNESTDPQQIVEQVFRKLQSIDPETYAEIQERLDSGEITELEAVAELIELMGYTIDWEKSTDDYLSVEIDKGVMITVEINNDLKDKRGNPLYGQYDRENKVLSINFQKHGKIAEVALTICHEMSHAFLTDLKLLINQEHAIIYSVEYSYMAALDFMEVEITQPFWNHILSQMVGNDNEGNYVISMYEFLNRWCSTSFPY